MLARLRERFFKATPVVKAHDEPAERARRCAESLRASLQRNREQRETIRLKDMEIDRLQRRLDQMEMLQALVMIQGGKIPPEAAAKFQIGGFASEPPKPPERDQMKDALHLAAGGDVKLWRILQSYVTQQKAAGKTDTDILHALQHWPDDDGSGL